jgi:hypothetical protein
MSEPNKANENDTSVATDAPEDEAEVDSTLAGSFPASDPPAWTTLHAGAAGAPCGNARPASEASPAEAASGESSVEAEADDRTKTG